ncbi:MAG TPA: glycoside hydrolase family 13 protein [Acidimicrobiales bacterium]|nr:glycoside hydrolase family 13 protein [Acidimicrobiales bacterium]
MESPHHDGSGLYVDNPAPALGDRVDVRVRAPANSGVSHVYVRALRDGEPSFHEATVDHRSGTEIWWRATVGLDNPITNYRFLLRLSAGGYRWLNGTGLHRHEVADDEDFRLTSFPPPPAWASGSVVYQIFPDRFASSGAERDWPSWAVPTDWDEGTVVYHGKLTPAQVFGGDLAGVESRLDYVAGLGANVIYLTPFFPSQSNHRYDATTFAAVDPLLGGDGALASLSAAAHSRGIRLLGDLTTNHTGSGHEWFIAAQADPSAPERSFYYWERDPPGYASWLGHPRLPKLNYSSPALWDRLVRGPSSVTARWLSAPYFLDGWRIDVANMTGRYRAEDFNAEIARAMRQTLAEVRPEAFLVAEHGHDFTPEVSGDGWHGVMNYAGFTKPAWTWLTRPANTSLFLGQPVEIPRQPGHVAARTMSQFLARVPWRVANHHFNLLCSHDTARIRTVSGDPAVVRAGAAMLFTFPGIPMVFSGDEIGIEGVTGEDSRRPFPWDKRSTWDLGALDAYRALGRLRVRSSALCEGGLRWAYQGDDTLAYLRESPAQRMLVLLTRAPSRDVVLDTEALNWSGEAVNVFGGTTLTAHNGKVTLPGDGPTAQVWELL